VARFRHHLKVLKQLFYIKRLMLLGYFKLEFALLSARVPGPLEPGLDLPDACAAAESRSFVRLLRTIKFLTAMSRL
jgi:hypothetical protein